MTIRKINGKEYEHVLKFWNKFELKMMKVSHDWYLKCNVLLLVNVFEKFTNNNLKKYGLCWNHCWSAPAFNLSDKT